MSGVNNEKSRKQKPWTPTGSLLLDQLMVHHTGSARLGRSQTLIWWSFGSLCWVFHLSNCRDRVRQFIWWCVKWSTPSAWEQGRVSQVEHKARHHHRGHARMLNLPLNNPRGRWNHERTHWPISILHLLRWSMHRNQPSLPIKRRHEKFHSKLGNMSETRWWFGTCSHRKRQDGRQMTCYHYPVCTRFNPKPN